MGFSKPLITQSSLDEQCHQPRGDGNSEKHQFSLHVHFYIILQTLQIKSRPVGLDWIRLNGLIRHGSKAEASRVPMASVMASHLITFEVLRVMQSTRGLYVIPVFDVGRTGVCRSQRLGQGRSEDVRQTLNLASIRTLVQPPQPHDVSERYAMRLPHRLQSGKRTLSRCLVLWGRNETIEARTSAQL
jgi:hypothetical protein